MITLITGTPGSGKTLFAIWSLLREIKAGRRIVVDGIPNLAIDHELVDEAWVRRWFDHVQPNDIVVVDEVQRIWPPVSVGVKPTEDIEWLHKHRHKGVDFVVITQHPNRMNKTIRDLVGRHVHVRRLFGLKQAMVYEWDHCHNPNAGFRDAVKTRWSYPKKVFELYTSSELHTKQKAVIPKALFIAPVALLIACWLGWKGFKSVSGGFGVGAAATVASASSAAAGVPAAAVAASLPGAGSKDPASGRWRVAGRYAVEGRGYVLLLDTQGHFRSELSDAFRGDALRLQGVVDGERVAVWSGAAADSDKPVGVQK
ncbi:zonular occludens toxin domain-containing protein [Paraburkholderia rhizosphaerae]|uniref:Zona occludens toxin n=1 Tax=Paraburkholderia rhizosphaerae TaxID=480658 RepID=A0A4R8LQT3_9BURK|nr:zonular occludens toxin domain-containing protein [Paraburkholderia rhizosphaerae]TDY47714.1 zona occludens toxin [Paraburkholderia rhizosphaerae]